MRFQLSSVAFLLLCFWGAQFSRADHLCADERPNVLFIGVDDLRPVLGCYNDLEAITPNIDRLASSGIAFQRAYCQLAVCCPSRMSLLSGKRPDSIRVWDLKTHFREALPDLVSLPEHFKNNGYFTQSIGKVFHGSGKPSKDPRSWSVNPLYDHVREPELRYARTENLVGEGLKRNSFEFASVDDEYYVDGKVCDAALSALQDCKERQKPFFLAVGFRKPHLPFCAPQKYWDLYDSAQLSLIERKQYPEGAPEFAIRSWQELEGYRDIPASKVLSDEKVRRLRHGYYACVSYIDALVGRLLGELETLQLKQNTLVVLWSDHGFHLGEQGLWAKANNYELAARVPLIISTPGIPAANWRCDALVELVDIYPTLLELCELPRIEGLEGCSMVPLWQDPSQDWKSAVFHQYPRMYKGARHKKHGEVMGYAVRSKDFRYVAWRDWESKRLLSQELYDLRRDSLESVNLAATPAMAQVLAEMQGYLDSGWQAAEPAR